MRQVVAAGCCVLLLRGAAGALSVTMPTDVPVTVTVDDPRIRGSRPEGPSREPREPREYGDPSASSAGPAEALAILSVIVAAPVIIVGRGLYLAGKRFSDWLEERRREREDARLREAERARLAELERERLAAVTAELERREAASREAEWGRVGLLVDALSGEEAQAGDFDFPYENVALETDRVVPMKNGKNKFARQNEFDADIMAAYRELWNEKNSPYQSLLKRVPPEKFKGIIAWESVFDPKRREECGFGAKRCLHGKRASMQGVGLLSMTRMNATDAKGAGLRVDAQVDERLDSAKSIRAALRSMSLIERELNKIYMKGLTAPNEEAMREFIVVAYNAGWPSMTKALGRAEKDLKKPLGEVRLADLMAPRAGGPSLLEEIVDKPGQPRKFKQETSKYLQSIDEWIEAAKPKKPQEKKP